MEIRSVRFPLILTILLVCLFSMSFVYADESSNMSFSIIHYINFDPQYQFVFKDASDNEVTTIVLDPDEINENFVSLYMTHNSNRIIKGLSVLATDLETRDKTSVFPYTMSLTDAKGNEIEWIADADGNGSGYADIISKTTVFRYRETEGTVKFADFSIDLSDSEVENGEYEGTISLVYVVI